MILFEEVSVAGSLLLADPSGRVRILSGGRQLQISIAEKSDAASYTCIASNVAGSTQKEYSLQVYSKFLGGLRARPRCCMCLLEVLLTTQDY